MTVEVKKVREIDVYSYRAGERQARVELEAELTELRKHAEWMALCNFRGRECKGCSLYGECYDGTPFQRYRARYPEET